MFGFSYIARKARQWRADHKRAAMESALMDLPRELRKDIGWPAPGDLPARRALLGSMPARPLL
ncbi:MAG: hypothetical protein Q8S27_19250 [Hoeflea sp.]|uniref:hypothetical protein n=1 Tax=Hoeflea sp. TaxID=1940281 RepID=UPI00272F26DB|nr:hypothetical protein [Hoeflea sp.]MDP2118383.1 hypothetical protein [Hoeflea sp.]MDP3526717.1 hypothetical protein [Hoeflea sp.]MDZ7603298.1 hypothetical protein [Hoeflea sp.]